jgi:hypothetical protein
MSARTPGICGVPTTPLHPAGLPGRRRAGPARSGRRPLGGWIFLSALVAGVLAGRAACFSHPLGTVLEIALASAMGVIGLGLLVSCRYGRTGPGTILLAVLTSAALAGAAALPKSITADWRDTTWAPTSAAAVRSTYELGTGKGQLKLGGVPLQKGHPLATRAEVGAGQLTVTVPDDATVQLSISVRLGDIQLPGEGKHDVDISPGQERTVTLPPVHGHASHGTLTLDLRVGVGRLEVVRA